MPCVEFGTCAPGRGLSRCASRMGSMACRRKLRHGIQPPTGWSQTCVRGPTYLSDEAVPRRALKQKRAGRRPCSKLVQHFRRALLCLFLKRWRRLRRSRSSQDLDRLGSDCPTRRRSAIAVLCHSARLSCHDHAPAAHRLTIAWARLEFSGPIRFHSRLRHRFPRKPQEQCDCRVTSCRSCAKPRRRPRSSRTG